MVVASPPIALWVRAITPSTRPPVGRDRRARAATAYGEHVAAEFGYGLADRDWTVVSGAAFGIDAAAHRPPRTRPTSPA